MKFAIVLFVWVTVFSSSASSQPIPNPGFETWAGGSPTGWYANNSEQVTTVTAVNDPHSGTFSAYGRIVMVAPDAYVTPFMAVGANGGGISISSRPVALRGWYKFTGVGGDGLVIMTGFKAGDAGIGAGFFAENDTRTIFREFVAPTQWVTLSVPDLAIIHVNIVGGGTQFHQGSSYVIDDLSFGPATDVEETSPGVPESFALDQNFPNPFNPTTKIQFQIPDAQFVTLKVYNLLGQEVAVLVNEQLTAGRYRAELNAADLPSGTYFYKLQAGSFTSTKKLQLVR